MSKRFGKDRVPECECTRCFTCRPCLKVAPPPIFTPSTLEDKIRALAAVNQGIPTPQERSKQ